MYFSKVKISNQFLMRFHLGFLLLMISFHGKIWFSDDAFLNAYYSSNIRIYLGVLFLITLILLFIFIRKKALSLAGALLLGLLFFLHDFSLQPFYLFSFFTLIAYGIDGEKFRTNIFVLAIMTYTISAFQKMNPLFFNEVVPYLLPDYLLGFSSLIAVLLISLEFLVPIYFLFKPKSPRAIGLFILINIGIFLVALFDSNIHITVVLWLFSLFSIACFSRNDVIVANLSSRFRVLVSLILIISVLSYIGLAPSYSSYKIYSGNTNVAFYSKNYKAIESIEKFFFKEYSLYPPPHLFVHKNIFKVMCELDKDNNYRFFVKTNENWLISGVETRQFNCG